VRNPTRSSTLGSAGGVAGGSAQKEQAELGRYAPLILLVVLGQAIIGFLLAERVVKYRLQGPPPEDLEETKVEASVGDEPEGFYRDLGVFMLNPADTSDIRGLRFLKTEISLGVSPAEVEEQLRERNPRVRDAIIRILSSKVVDEIDNPEDREFVKDEIRFAVERTLPPGPSEVLIQVFFSDFVIQ